MIGRDGRFHWFICPECYHLSQPPYRATEEGALFRCPHCGCERLAARGPLIVSLKI